jgi:predicted AAA+ superfamily ATPase
MIKRPFWIKTIENAWRLRPIVWLSGARRSGKTTLSKMFDGITYMNCDLPSVGRRLEDPELFYAGLPAKTTVVFDEIHRFSDPSRVLKIAADEHPDIKILATGSSTLEATKKFRDSLTGRKTSVYLSPVLWDECQDDFNISDLDRRLLHGGLPEPLMADKKDPGYFSEWMDSFFARDIQELFNVRNRTGYLRLMQLLYRSSGNLIDFTQLSKQSELSRPTVVTYLESLQIAGNIFILRPYHGGGKRELTHRPKYYAFDTGMVTFVKGWNVIREEDRGILWEHLVLDLLRSYYPNTDIFYWQDKSKREIDFIVKQPNDNVDTYECKINQDNFNVFPLTVFRESNPNGRNFCICPYIKESYKKNIQGHIVEFIGRII